MMRRVLRGRLKWLLLLVGVLLALAAFWLWRWYSGHDVSDSNTYIRQWLVAPDSHTQLNSAALVACPGAPFILPSEGFIGLLWADPAAPYTLFQRHTGIDIFGRGNPGTVPIYAAYDGYLSRLADWRSTVIIRHDDPLQSGRTIWTYYTHMASRDGQESYIAPAFPPGTHEVYVEQGTLVGYQGDYNGNSFPIAMHLHFSIVTSDEAGNFRNEAILGNTLDPSPYFGMPLNMAQGVPESRPIRCLDEMSQ